MRKKEILLVEDNDDDIVLTQRALKKANVTNDVVVARDGVEAINYLFGTNGNTPPGGRICPAVILLDIKLPKIDGLEVLKRIRSDDRTRTCPVVILTSSREESDVVEGYKRGANSYIRKPVEFERFVEAVRQLGLYWLVLNETPPPRTS